MLSPLNCPNCSAPIDFEDERRPLVCIYCKTSFLELKKFRSEKKKFGARRSPEEIELAQLRNEKTKIDRLLSIARQDAESLQQSQNEFALSTWSLSRHKAVSERNSMILSGLIVGVLGYWLFGWNWPLWVMGIFFFGAAFTEISSRKKPKFTVGPPALTENENEMMARLNEIIEEIQQREGLPNNRSGKAS